MNSPKHPAIEAAEALYLNMRTGRWAITGDEDQIAFDLVQALGFALDRIDRAPHEYICHARITQGGECNCWKATS